MSTMRPRVVFDCNVLLQAAARSQGPSADCAHVHADYLVTRDDDFHRLKTAHDKMGKAFRRRFRALHVLDPIEFLAAIRDRME